MMNYTIVRTFSKVSTGNKRTLICDKDIEECRAVTDSYYAQMKNINDNSNNLLRKFYLTMEFSRQSF